MRCAQCNSSAITMVDQDGGEVEGQFWEEYECVDCGAAGTVRGTAEQNPTEWTQTGRLYNNEQQS